MTEYQHLLLLLLRGSCKESISFGPSGHGSCFLRTEARYHVFVSLFFGWLGAIRVFPVNCDDPC